MCAPSLPLHHVHCSSLSLPIVNSSLLCAVFRLTHLSFCLAMAFDLIILLLCAYRLVNNRFTNGLATQLFRDGIVCLVLSPVRRTAIDNITTSFISLPSSEPTLYK